MKLEMFGTPVSFDPRDDQLIPGEGVSCEMYNRKYAKAMFGLLADANYHNEDEPYYDFYKAIVRDVDRDIFSAAGLRFDSTVIMKGCAGGEYKKTAGHFHCEIPGKGMRFPELYQVVKGRALFVMQKVDGCRNAGNMVVKDAVLAEAGPGEAIIVPPDYGHCTANISGETMVFVNLVALASENHYDSVRASAGMCCYVMRDGDGYRVEQNPRYTFACAPRIVTPVDSAVLGLEKGLPAYTAFLRDPSKFSYLCAPENNVNDFFSVFRTK